MRWGFCVQVNFINTVATPSVVISGWPDESIVAKIYVSKNNIPCEVEVGARTGLWDSNETVTMNISDLKESGVYNFYIKAVDFAGNQSSCEEAPDIYEFTKS